ncbi:MAG: AAA family ATPase [Muribaculaceae bacterium]|nr:AAA family ATPase [Muribaculaceae bacterium]
MKERIFKRKIYSRILQWKIDRAGRTALLIKGARRVGKSTITREFAQREYRTHIIIDFAKVGDDVRRLFDDMTDMNFFFLQLQAIFHTTLHERESVIIFDEVQFCPKARQAIKYLVEDGRYDYIETGSLLSIRRNIEGILIPSEETRITMYPMDYEEFLWAIGDQQTMELIKYSYDNLKRLDDDLHRRLMRQFRLYMLVGGMPQAVNAYLDTNNLAMTDEVKREILELYSDDLRKIDPSGRISRIFESIPGELAKSKLRFEVGGVIENADKLNYDDIWKDLEDSMIVNFAYRTSDPNVGMGLHKDMNTFRLYLADTGLFITLAFLDRDVADNDIYTKLLSDKLSADMGYVYENVVAQMLKTAGHSLYYYTFPTDATRKNHYEIDFLISKGKKIDPIEVKSSGYRTHKSLDVFCEKYSSCVGMPIILYTKSLQKEKSLLYLPVYMTPLL